MQKSRFTGPRLTAGLIVVVLVAALWFMVRTPALEVEAAPVTRGAMQVTVDDIGETRVRDLYSVAAPVSGELLRVPFKPGARVSAGQLVAELQSVQATPIDRRTFDETLARIATLRAEVAAADARTAEARAAEQLASVTHRRYQVLVEKGFVSRALFDAATADLQRTRAANAAAVQGQRAASHSLQAAQASLAPATRAAPGGQLVRVIAPVSGSVLRVLQESGGPVAAGTPLIEIGDPGRIEVFSEMLSADAVRVVPGAAVQIESWGGEVPLKGRVRVVEPFGFRKISALGVEENRVKVVIDLTEPRAAWQRLGHGYRVVVRVVQWSAGNVLQAPIGALFRQRSGWAAFVVDKDGKAQLVSVKLGHFNEETAEVLGGLDLGQQVIVYPSEKVREGTRVKPGR
jgi:HlyD family secretion protein